MAGMLPGVECARRRRLHQGGSSGGFFEQSISSRRSSFCLYRSGYESHLSNSFMQPRILNKDLQEVVRDDIAREAKERLDARLLGIKSLRTTKSMNETTGASLDEDTMMPSKVITREVYSDKKSSKRFSWSKFTWKASEQTECVICLDEFKARDVLVHLPCAHRFHWSCAMPWIESNSLCPCCRMAISGATIC